MKLAENINYSEPVEFSAWKGQDDKTAFSVKQGGENVPQKYTRDDPGDCPPPVQGFNKKWNFDAQKEYLHERMVNVVIPKVKAVNGNDEHQEEQNEDVAPTNGNSEVSKDQLLKNVKDYLKEYATEEKVTPKDAIETWFGTRIWEDVEKMDLSVLQPMAQKLAEHVVPF